MTKGEIQTKGNQLQPSSKVAELERMVTEMKRQNGTLLLRKLRSCKTSVFCLVLHVPGGCKHKKRSGYGATRLA